MSFSPVNVKRKPTIFERSELIKDVSECKPMLSPDWDKDRLESVIIFENGHSVMGAITGDQKCVEVNELRATNSLKSLGEQTKSLISISMNNKEQSRIENKLVQEEEEPSLIAMAVENANSRERRESFSFDDTESSVYSDFQYGPIKNVAESVLEQQRRSPSKGEYGRKSAGIKRKHRARGKGQYQQLLSHHHQPPQTEEPQINTNDRRNLDNATHPQLPHYSTAIYMQPYSQRQQGNCVPYRPEHLSRYYSLSSDLFAERCRSQAQLSTATGFGGARCATNNVVARSHSFHNAPSSLVVAESSGESPLLPPPHQRRPYYYAQQQQPEQEQEPSVLPPPVTLGTMVQRLPPEYTSQRQLNQYSMR